MNPLKHLDPLGTIALFASGMFGWDKPVPINPLNFRDISKGLLWVALAGPLSNILLAILFAALYRLSDAYGSALALSAPNVFRPIFIMMEASIVINISLAVFNLIPVPPLDGSKVLSSLLPADKAFQFSRIEPYGFMILFLLILTGVINWFVSPVVYLAAGLRRMVGAMAKEGLERHEAHGQAAHRPLPRRSLQLAEAPEGIRVLLLRGRLARPHTDYSNTASSRTMSGRWCSTGSVGIDPAASTVFLQSRILEHASFRAPFDDNADVIGLRETPHTRADSRASGKDLNTFGFSDTRCFRPPT